MNAPAFHRAIPAISVVIAAAALLTSCAIDEYGNPIFGLERSPPPPPEPNPQSKYYSSLHHIVVNEEQLESLTPANSRIEINLAAQRARVFRSAGRNEVKDLLVIETQISTGKQGHGTPSGKYKILEKKEEKDSNLYGKWVNADTGETIIEDGDSREPPEDVPNAEFQGTPMPYWLRITPGGVGMHIGQVPNYPASHGCIRVPNKVQPLIFRKTRVGTPVQIINRPEAAEPRSGTGWQ